MIRNVANKISRKTFIAGCYVATFSIVATITGCATIINEKTQRINVMTSTGDKVDINIDGIPFQAPGIASVIRKKGDKIITTSDPRCAQSTIVPSSVDTVFFINVLSGGVFGSTTDYVSEKMWKYEDSVIISCKK